MLEQNLFYTGPTFGSMPLSDARSHQICAIADRRSERKRRRDCALTDLSFALAWQPDDGEGLGLDCNLYKVIYCSRSEIRGTGEEVADKLLSLLESAQSKNQHLNITGALLFYSGVFAQVVEGPRDSVEHLFSLIQFDDRHSEVTVAFRGPELERDFPGWSMAFTDGSMALAEGDETSKLFQARAAMDAVFASQEGAGERLLAALKTLR